MTKFTPGPWRVLSSRGLNACEIRGADGEYLADVWGKDNPVPNGVQRGAAKANARLIAAAPDLLAACALVEAHFSRNKASGNFQCDDEHEAWTAVTAALAKAEVRS